MPKVSQENYQIRKEIECVFFLFVCFKTISCFLLQIHNVFLFVCLNGIKCEGGKRGRFFLGGE